MKYLVMEKHAGYVILLDEEGRFLRAADRGYEVGQTLKQPLILGEMATAPRRSLAKQIMAFSLAACLLFAVGFGIWETNFAVYTSVHITINPDLRIDLNRSGKVLAIQALNDDATVLLDGYEEKGKDRRTVTDEIISRAIEMGYLEEGDEILLDVEAKKASQRAEYEEEFLARIDHALGDMNVQVNLVGSPSLPETDESTGSDQTSLPPETNPPDSQTTPPDTDPPVTDPPVTDPPQTDPNPITASQALSIALKHAGLAQSAIRELESELVTDDGPHYYEIEFLSSGYEYEYKINLDGNILEHKKEIDD